MPAACLKASRVPKRAWYELGGFSNPQCFRRATSNGGWTYWVRND